MGRFPCRAVAFKDKSFTSISVNYTLSFQVMKALEQAPEQSQRALSDRCGVSLGSIHYCLKGLIDKGYVKAENFKNAQNKLAYAYILTPAGINLKKELTMAFLRRKQVEYERAPAGDQGVGGGPGALRAFRG